MKYLNKCQGLFGQERLIQVLAFTVLAFLILITGCSKPASWLIPYIPPQYYQCMEATPGDLEKAYFSNYGDKTLATINYNDKMFIFKRIFVTDLMQQQFNEKGYFWVASSKCVPTAAGLVARIKSGDCIDIVGINRGIPKDPDYQWSLLMEDCYYLPAGELALPASGGATFSPGY